MSMCVSEVVIEGSGTEVDIVEGPEGMDLATKDLAVIKREIKEMFNQKVALKYISNTLKLLAVLGRCYITCSGAESSSVSSCRRDLSRAQYQHST